MKTSDVLNRAADLIEERGWTSGNCGMAVDGPLCLEGAIGAALGTRTEIHRFSKWMPTDLDKGQEFYPYADIERTDAYAAIVAHLDIECEAWSWNDESSRTAAEVIEVLRACAVIESAREDQDAAWETYAESVTA